jgi:hypothetical protein
MNLAAFLDALVHDLRQGLRALRRNRGFATTALLTLAIGTGAKPMQRTRALLTLLAAASLAAWDRLGEQPGSSQLWRYGMNKEPRI